MPSVCKDVFFRGHKLMPSVCKDVFFRGLRLMYIVCRDVLRGQRSAKSM